MQRLADFVIDFLVKKGINTVFLVSGGGIMYLTDAVGKNKKVSYYANHHEQASATCAESWARMTGKPGVCLVTTGPGSTNAITGVAAAWVDSIPMIVISGQVKRRIIANYNKTRQKGPQEINIIPMVKPITKYATTVMNPNEIQFKLEKAFHEAITGRPGPVWMNIPLDVQNYNIKDTKLKKFNPSKVLNEEINKYDIIVKSLRLSKRPVLVCGSGIRLSGSTNVLLTLLKKWHIPTISHVGGVDLIPYDYRYHMGVFGPNGQRRANFCLQNADLLLCLGSSMNVASTGFDFKGFAPKATKILVNIDIGANEASMIKFNYYIRANVDSIITKLNSDYNKFPINTNWLRACLYWKKKYPIILPEYRNTEYINSYVFMDVLSSILKSKDVLTTGIGLDVVSMYQAFKVKEGQRVYVNKNFGQMGWDLPAVIGACIANNKKNTICVTGDGSIQFNIQELQTIKTYKLPIKIFIFNNKGYSSIRSTQENLFNGLYVGAENKSGVENPSFKDLAAAYGFRYTKIKSGENLKKILTDIVSSKNQYICEILISPKQEIIPKAKAYRDKQGNLVSKPLEDMYPYLPKEEVWDNMHKFDNN